MSLVNKNMVAFALLILIFNILIFILDANVEVNRYKCTEIPPNRCEGIEFRDPSGRLRELLDRFEVEFLLDGASMDTATWINNESYPNGGYLLFAVFGGPGMNKKDGGIYRYYNDLNDNILIEQLVNISYATDVAVDFEYAPNRMYVASVFKHAIYVIDFTTFEIIAEYTRYNGLRFAGPDGLYADKKGNMYFTDIDLKVPISKGIVKLKSGSIFRINLKNNDEITRVHFGEYGYDGIDGNGGNPNIIVATNTIDVPEDEYEPFNNTHYNRSNIYIAQFEQQNDGSLIEIDRLFSIDDAAEYFPTKPFLDGMSYDWEGNVWFATQINHTYSKLSVVNGNGEFLGEIELGDEFELAGIYYADDGYFYGGMVKFSTLFHDGKFFRIPSKNVNKKKKKKM